MRDRVARVFADCRIQQAFRYITHHEDQIEAEQIRLTEIAAPPFGETARATAFCEALQKAEFVPAIDSIGNVLCPYEGSPVRPVVVAAHLDTVFPASTPLRARRNGRIIELPGISDNGAGLVALLWVFRAARKAGIRFQRPVLAVGNVGEEGEGNLRGMRHLWAEAAWKEAGCEFIAVDGAGIQRITNQALGSRRLRIQLVGPGGHSWADFGRPNPVQALATAIHSFCHTGYALRPGCTFNFGVIRGGISVNAIPREASTEVDLRSTSASDVENLELRLRRIVVDIARSSQLEHQIELMGERPSGLTAAGSAIVQAASEVTRRIGVEPQLDIGSTDANIPISLGIPAIALGGGGRAGKVHTSEEWFDPSGRDLGIRRLLALIAVLAGLD